MPYIPSPFTYVDPRTFLQFTMQSRVLKRTIASRTAMVLNCGSSSVKYQLITNQAAVLRGSIDNIGSPNCIHSVWSPKASRTASLDGISYASAIGEAIESAVAVENDIYCVGHRVVHGGPKLTRPTMINDTVLEDIRACNKLAPLHNPSNVKGIELMRSMLKSVPQVACFDTAFHANIPPKASRYAIPRDLADSLTIRRYGFHGNSYAYISNIVNERRTIVLHLGSGCSAAAIVDGVSIDTTMGFTPMEGLVMSTRSGSIDPGLILHLANEFSGDLDKLSQILNKKSGLGGISGFSSDMKALLRVEKIASDPNSVHAHEAVEVFVYTVQKYIGQLLAALEFRVDAIIFTGGIGENSAEIRSRVIEGVSGLGVVIDTTKNAQIPPDGIVSAPNSPIKVLAIRTNEEHQIARDAIAVVETSS